MQFVAAFVLTVLSSPAIADETDLLDAKLCEIAVVLVTRAYVANPIDASARVALINEERERMAADTPEATPGDSRFTPAYLSLISHLLELDRFESSRPLSSEEQLQLAARAGATCGARRGDRAAP